MARRHGAFVVDLWGMRSLRDWRMWAEDRIHLTTDGHARVAQGALVGLGLTPDDAAWDDPLTPLPPTPRMQKAREDAAWVREHLYPWATRRLRGTSSGDDRVAQAPGAVAGRVSSDDRVPKRPSCRRSSEQRRPRSRAPELSPVI